MDKDFKKNWKKALETRKNDTGGGGGYAEWPNGEYVVDLVGAERGVSKKSNRPQVRWELAVVDGPDGTTKEDIIYKYDGLRSDLDLVWFQRRLESMGLEVPEDPEGALDALLVEVVAAKPRYKMRMWKKGNFQNFKLSLNQGDESTEAEEPQDVTVED